jgi:hypothetical protein
VRSPAARYEMGSRPNFQDGLRVQGRAPLPGRWKLVCNGKVVAEGTGRTFDTPAAEPGNYRVEVWLRVGGEDTIWILSNPLYVRPAGRP